MKDSTVPQVPFFARLFKLAAVVFPQIHLSVFAPPELAYNH